MLNGLFPEFLNILQKPLSDALLQYIYTSLKMLKIIYNDVLLLQSNSEGILTGCNHKLEQYLSVVVVVVFLFFLHRGMFMLIISLCCNCSANVVSKTSAICPPPPALRNEEWNVWLPECGICFCLLHWHWLDVLNWIKTNKQEKWSTTLNKYI